MSPPLHERRHVPEPRLAGPQQRGQLAVTSFFSASPTSLMNEAARIAIACDVDRSNRSRMRIPSVRFLSSRLTFAVFSASASGQGTRRSRSPFSWSSRSKRPPSEKPSA